MLISIATCFCLTNIFGNSARRFKLLKFFAKSVTRTPIFSAFFGIKLFILIKVLFYRFFVIFLSRNLKATKTHYEIRIKALGGLSAIRVKTLRRSR